MEKKNTQDENIFHNSPINSLSTNSTRFNIEESPAVIIVRAEEILLVVLVLIIWLAAIALFFNRWGKIRMLEPYQPKFQQQHRPSCPLSDSVISPQQRMSFSKFASNGCDNSLYATQPLISPYRRPRQNSVFVNSSFNLRPPRRVKSAIDIQQMFAEPGGESFRSFSSVLPMTALNLNGDKKAYFALDKTPQTARPKASIVVDQPVITRHCQPSRNYLRRPSCFLDKPRTEKHTNFISLDQPIINRDRRLSIAIERLPCTRRKPLINIEHSCAQPSLRKQSASNASGDSDNIIVTESNLAENMSNSSFNSEKCPSIHLDIPSPGGHAQFVLESFEPAGAENHSADGADGAAADAADPCDDNADDNHIKLSALENCKVSDV